MPVVPKLDSPQVKQAALSGARVSPDAPIEAFGGGQGLEQTNQAIQGVHREVIRMLTEEKHKADEIAVQDADNKDSAKQTEIQVEIGKLKGREAAGAIDYAEAAWKDHAEETRKGLSNDDQRSLYEKSHNNRFELINKHVQLHTAGEMQNYDNEVNQEGIKSAHQEGLQNYYDPESVAIALNNQRANIEKFGIRNGKGDEWIKNEVADKKSKLVAGIVERHLSDGAGQRAKDYYDANLDSVLPSDRPAIENKMQKELNLDRGAEAWAKMQAYKLSDGTPDEAKMESAIRARKDLKEEDKVDVLRYVKARASEEVANTKRQDTATELKFMNEIVNNRKKGAPMEGALRFANQYAKNPYDLAIKTEAIHKLYAPPTESDPGAYMNLWEKVEKGTATREELDKAFERDRQINVGDWRKLTEKFLKDGAEGKNPEMKNAWERVAVLAETQYGDKKVRDAFLYELHATAGDKSAEEIWKIANDKLKNDPGTGYFGFFQSNQWKSDMQKRDAQSLAWGKAHQDLGKDETSAISQGMALKSGKPSDISDIDSFAANFGGYDNIKPGTPVHTAIQSLLRHKQPVTPSNVNAVLGKFKDGKY